MSRLEEQQCHLTMRRFDQTWAKSEVEMLHHDDILDKTSFEDRECRQKQQQQLKVWVCPRGSWRPGEQRQAVALRAGDTLLRPHQEREREREKKEEEETLRPMVGLASQTRVREAGSVLCHLTRAR